MVDYYHRSCGLIFVSLSLTLCLDHLALLFLFLEAGSTLATHRPAAERDKWRESGRIYFLPSLVWVVNVLLARTDTHTLKYTTE